MAVANKAVSARDQIGEAAGAVWRYLDAHGEVTTAKLIKDSKIQRDLLMQALGWLAREDKISVDNSRSKKISLRDET